MKRQALKVLEFYSGIGGMHYALQRVCPAAVVLDAFDVNHAANAVYHHNFGKAPRQVDLAAITAADLDAYAADLWLMAPPCQPFTRQGKQLGGADNRSNSFLHLLQQLQLMQAQPQGLLVENVVGFQESDVRDQLAAALARCGYHMQEFILTPTQYGVPYSRPRYFCIASKQPLPVSVPGLHQPCLCTPALLRQLQQQRADAQTIMAAAQQRLASHVQQVPTLGEYLSLPLPPPVQHPHNQHISQQQVEASPQGQQPHLPPPPPPQQQQQHCEHQDLQQQQMQPSHQQHEQQGPMEQPQCPPHQPPGRLQSACSPSSVITAWQWVPDKVLQKHADCIDVATRSSRSCNCFTKAYGHFARGTGSLLATVADPSAVDERWLLVAGSGSLELSGYTPPAQRSSSSPNTHIDVEGTSSATSAAAGTEGAVGSGVTDVVGEGKMEGSEDLVAAWQKLGLRYFTVLEIAQLHSFPDSFSLPSGFSSRQGYQLLGNSLSVAVVADLLAYLLESVSLENYSPWVPEPTLVY